MIKMRVATVMRAARFLLPQATIGMALLLASCAKPPPPPITPPPPIVPTIMPLPPLGSAENMDLPNVDAQGVFITPNRGMTGQQALWHVRMALNVAALGCRDANRAMATQYNAMLHIHIVPLNQANMAANAIYALKFGVDATRMRETINTTVYNFFSLPPAQKAFCPTALAVVTTINGMTPEALLAYAPQALTMLEQPFQAFWEAYADYLARLDEWRRRYGRGTVTVLPCPPSDPECTGAVPPMSPLSPPVAIPADQPPATPPRLPLEAMPPD